MTTSDLQSKVAGVPKTRMGCSLAKVDFFALGVVLFFLLVSNGDIQRVTSREATTYDVLLELHNKPLLEAAGRLLMPDGLSFGSVIRKTSHSYACVRHM